TLWPEAQVYLLRSNAKAYLLFQQINQEVLTHFTFDQEWEQQIKAAILDQEAWLRKYIVPQLERTGVAPNGLFEIQDVHKKETALGVERWTSAEDWLTFLEAAH